MIMKDPSLPIPLYVKVGTAALVSSCIEMTHVHTLSDKSSHGALSEMLSELYEGKVSIYLQMIISVY